MLSILANVAIGWWAGETRRLRTIGEFAFGLEVVGIPGDSGIMNTIEIRFN